MIESVIREILRYFAEGISLISSLIIIWGVVVAIKEFLKAEFIMDSHSLAAQEKRKEIRQRLGGHLLLGLEVLIAADIIETISNPTVAEVAKLASIVIIRTFISYFLEKELKEEF